MFSPDDLDESARRLRRAGAFSSVAMQEADRLGPGNTMDITATVVESLPRRFGFGAEVSSSDGVNLNGYWMHRNLFGGRRTFGSIFRGRVWEAATIRNTASALSSPVPRPLTRIRR